MSPEKTVSKLRSAPAPSLTATLDAKPAVGPAHNRDAVAASLIRGPCIREMRTALGKRGTVRRAEAGVRDDDHQKDRRGSFDEVEA